jgi:hypothetical protein
MKKFFCCLPIIFLFHSFNVFAQQVKDFNGLGLNLGNLQKLSSAKTYSISPENFMGEKGKGGMAQLSDSVYRNKAIAARQARELGQGWKLNPAIKLLPGETFTLAEINGSGAIQHIWMTPSGNWRLSILRIYWDDEKEPSVECPVGDFFGMGLNKFAQISSLAVTVNPGSGFNCFWTMPFRKKCKITVENLNKDDFFLFYQVDYTLTKVDDDDAYFHAEFRKTPADHKGYNSIYTMIDGIKGTGQYVGTYMTWKQPNWLWWGEGEIKFYIDGDKQFPTINGTGTEDYFLGSYGFDMNGKTQTFTTPYVGLPQQILPDSTNKLKYPQFAMYRWHIMDPVRFEKDLKITMQDLGWKDIGQTYLAQQSDITSVVFWYQAEPHNSFPKLPSKEELEASSK